MRNVEQIQYLPSSPCPHCGVEAPAAFIDKAACPRVGDFTVCEHCHSPAIFDERMFRRQMTPVEAASFRRQFPAVARKCAQMALMWAHAQQHGIAQA